MEGLWPCLQQLGASLKQRAPDTLKDWDDIAAVQAASEKSDIDTGLAPDAQSSPATRGRGKGRGKSRGHTGRGHTGRGALRPISKKLKK